MREKATYFNKSKIREALYLEDIKRASRLSPEEKLEEALELSDFCLELNKVLKDGKSKRNHYLRLRFSSKRIAKKAKVLKEVKQILDIIPLELPPC